ncbi:Peroxidase N1 [Linum grandiflorum]
MGRMTLLFVFCFLMVLVLANRSVDAQGTRVGFYSASCPRAESIVRSTVQSHFNSDPTIAPGILRMHFHDCFVHGCDGSILIDGPNAERTAVPNRQLRGYDVIEDAKTQIEAACPGVVSCADILALAARDSVAVTNGPSWTVPTGRRDGRVSLASDTTNLPAFNDSAAVQIGKYNQKGLNTQDLVALSGAHTIGTAACAVFRYRLYNFPGSASGADPTLDPAFVPQLRAVCPQNGDPARRVAMDTGSPNRFDNSYYANLRSGRTVLESDSVLWTDAGTRVMAQRFLGIRGLAGLTFAVEFGRSMVRMGNIEIKSGAQGEIRRVCSAVN